MIGSDVACFIITALLRIEKVYLPGHHYGGYGDALMLLCFLGQMQCGTLLACLPCLLLSYSYLS